MNAWYDKRPYLIRHETTRPATALDGTVRIPFGRGIILSSVGGIMAILKLPARGVFMHRCYTRGGALSKCC